MMMLFHRWTDNMIEGKTMDWSSLQKAWLTKKLKMKLLQRNLKHVNYKWAAVTEVLRSGRTTSLKAE